MSYHKIDRLPGEVFKEIDGYDGYYEISNMGRVLSWHKGKFRFLKTGGYDRQLIILQINGVRDVHKINCLVWDYFGNKKRDGHKLVVTRINKDYSDNKITNLKLVSARILTHLSYKGEPGSKHIGVHYDGTIKGKEWKSTITINRKRVGLGYFKTQEDASNAYQKRLAEIQEG